ncbi:MAG TPA: cupredoxin domain-containing protein [Acidimicrobiales bacterium]
MRSTRRRWWPLAAAMLAVTLTTAMTACGDDDDTGDEPEDGSASAPAEGGGGDATLDVTEFQFSDVTAPAGGTLQVVNSSGAPHTVTADDGAFDEELADGATISVTVPTEPGEYPYHCEIHPSMQATLTVE